MFLPLGSFSIFCILGISFTVLDQRNCFLPRHHTLATVVVVVVVDDDDDDFIIYSQRNNWTLKSTKQKRNYKDTLSSETIKHTLYQDGS